MDETSSKTAAQRRLSLTGFWGARCAACAQDHARQLPDDVQYCLKNERAALAPRKLSLPCRCPHRYPDSPASHHRATHTWAVLLSVASSPALNAGLNIPLAQSWVVHQTGAISAPRRVQSRWAAQLARSSRVSHHRHRTARSL